MIDHGGKFAELVFGWQNAKEQKLLRSKILLKWEKVKFDTFSKVKFFPNDESIFEFKFQNPSKVENVPGLPKWFSPRPPEGGLTRAQKKTFFEKSFDKKISQVPKQYLFYIYNATFGRVVLWFMSTRSFPFVFFFFSLQFLEFLGPVKNLFN